MSGRRARLRRGVARPFDVGSVPPCVCATLTSMGYRDDAVAMQTRIEVLETELSTAERRAEVAEDELEELRHAIRRLRAGVREEDLLRKDPHLVASEGLLPIAGMLGIMATLAAATVLAPYTFQGGLDLSLRGFGVFGRQIMEGGWATIALLLVAVQLAVLPSVASIGMHMRKRFGWYAGIAAYSLWAAVCPPLGLYGLYALSRKKVRDALIAKPMAAPKVRVEIPPDGSRSVDEVIAQSQAHRLAGSRRRRAR